MYTAILLSAAWLQTTQFKFAERIMLPAANDPNNVTASYDFPLAHILFTVLGWVLGIIVLLCIGMFFVSAAGIVQSVRGKNRKEGAIGGNVAGMVAALIVGVLTAVGASNFWDIANSLNS